MNVQRMVVSADEIAQALSAGDTVRTDLVAVSAQSIERMETNARQMGEMILQLGTMISTMQRRLDQLESQQAQVTVSHGDVKRLQALIRYRAGELCRKYALADAESAKVFRSAIKRDVLLRHNVKDLHDLPASRLPAAEAQVNGWTDIRLAMERRGNG